MVYSNPIGAGLSPERIDMGVDYGGSGPLYALGSGTIANLYNSGWPGGTFLTIHLDSGQYVYYAEDIQPLVNVGQKVTGGEHIANATGGSSGIEIGWAAPPGTGETMAASAGQQSKSGDPGSVSTAFGQLMSELIASLGGPAGKLQGAISGSIPSSFGITPGTSQATANLTSSITSTGLGGILSIPEDIIKFFDSANGFVTKLMWLLNPASWLRIGSFFVAMILLIGAIIIFTKADQKITAMPVPVPI
jgi:murein DD-endopeptidase MepM/ murein hydrolase activator NlpD